ncbi:hypothetical protein V6N12_058141 [Hibiscus sabdariffa]|uniref:RNase H type-1 domain-containing protein n=1 Tax=Hibiscus sabdariffa TaxID=183260 RepID=A0ABR1Z7L0_9ROSI
MNFLNHIGLSDLVFVELLAIKEALVLFAKSAWASGVSLVVETDCNIVVGWLQNPTTAPFTFKDAVEDCLVATVGLE